jgi:hypothetical protein
VSVRAAIGSAHDWTSKPQSWSTTHTQGFAVRFTSKGCQDVGVTVAKFLSLAIAEASSSW